MFPSWDLFLVWSWAVVVVHGGRSFEGRLSRWWRTAVTGDRSDDARSPAARAGPDAATPVPETGPSNLPTFAERGTASLRRRRPVVTGLATPPPPADGPAHA